MTFVKYTGGTMSHHFKTLQDCITPPPPPPSWCIKCYDSNMKTIHSENIPTSPSHNSIDDLEKHNYSIIVITSPSNHHHILTPNNLKTHCPNNLNPLQNVFMSITLEYKGEEHDIELSGGNFNLYATNNCIDKYLLHYYLSVIMKKDVGDLHAFEYKLEIMDDDINIHQITHEDHIKMLHDGKYSMHIDENNK